jgi:hypothetical protein
VFEQDYTFFGIVCAISVQRRMIFQDGLKFSATFTHEQQVKG